MDFDDSPVSMNEAHQLHADLVLGSIGMKRMCETGGRVVKALGVSGISWSKTCGQCSGCQPFEFDVSADEQK